jgi:cation/acetate symporter
MYNGMAAAADWMSAASFISLPAASTCKATAATKSRPAAWPTCWAGPGGFCLLALLIAPHLRRMNLYTVPDYFNVRFGGRGPRIIAALAAVLCSFLYVVAQIYGVGLIASRLTGVQFEIGILLGLGGVLLCSFLGGMKAITWTQVAQLRHRCCWAFLIPVSWLAYKQLGKPRRPSSTARSCRRSARWRRSMRANPAERRWGHLPGAPGIRGALPDIEARWRANAPRRRAHPRQLKRRAPTPPVDRPARNSRASALPRATPPGAREQWTRAMNESYERARPLGGVPRHSQPFAGDPNGTPQQRDDFDLSRRNFLALMFCLMLGTRACRTCSRATTRRPASRARAPRWPGRCSSSRWCTSARRRWRRW